MPKLTTAIRLCRPGPLWAVLVLPFLGLIPSAVRAGGAPGEALFVWLDWPGFLTQWTPGYPGGGPGVRGRLVVNYPVLITVLLILAILAVLVIGGLLFYWFHRRWVTLETRLDEMEKSVKDLHHRQQADLEVLFRHLESAHPNGPGRPAPGMDLEEDTYVGKKK